MEASTNDFTQFFEICDVIDEYHHSSDLLVKYLKLYQIIEYFITRAVLVKIQENNSNQNLFLREMTGLSKFEDFDKNNFNLVFMPNKTDLGNWFSNFLTRNPASKFIAENFYTKMLKLSIQQIKISVIALYYQSFTRLEILLFIIKKVKSILLFIIFY